MSRWRITQRLERNRHGDVVDVLERAYLDYFVPVLGEVVPLSNHASASVDGAACDGLIVSGGGEVPRRFLDGAVPADADDKLAEEKYALQSRFVTEAMKAGKPVIGICYGSQLVNAMLGGRVAWSVHDGAADRKPGLAHDVDVAATRWTKTPGRFSVNSFHNQGVRRADLARDLESLAVDAQYDIVEAAIHKTLPVLCVQWHPERPSPDPAFHRALIAAFLGGNDMKAIILAAGEGRRLKKYTQDLPKGMLQFHGKSLIEHQINRYRACGITDIVVVRGFAADKISFPGVRYVENADFAGTNMVESLFRARAEFKDDVLVSYADVYFSERLLRDMIQSPWDVSVSVDGNWEVYWKKRYDRVDFDTESLAINAKGSITSLGVADPPLQEISARYIGVLKFAKAVLPEMEKIYTSARATHWEKPWQQSGKPFRQAYMTDLLQEMIDRGMDVHAVQVHGGWLEFDTDEDYERQRTWPIDF